MADTFTHTSSKSWLARIVSSVAGVLVGVVLFFASFPLLWWNEGRAVQTQRSLEEGEGAVVASPAETIDPSKDGKLVHMSGMLATQYSPT